MKTSLKFLIGLTVVFTLAGAYSPQLRALLALSWAGMEHFYFWQLATYPFVELGSLSFFFLLQLAFNMYLLWVFGSSVLEMTRTSRFFILYFGSTILAGLAVLPLPHAVLAGSTTGVYAVLTAWMMAYQGARLNLFFALPFKAHWLIVGLLGLTLFFDISASNWVGAISTGVSALFGYLFALVIWRHTGPFAILRPMENRLLRLLEKKEKAPAQHTKIYDIKSGDPVFDDNQFMDAMLDQISRRGEESLTPDQKRRMHEISKKKNHK